MQIILYVLLWSLPIVFATLSAWAFAISFYRVRANKIGITIKRNWVPFSIRRRFKKLKNDKEEEINWGDTAEVETMMTKIMKQSQLFLHLGTGIEPTQHHRRTVLIATMEYNIEDWDIKIKIGGLGVMSGLMGQHLGHQDLVWVSILQIPSLVYNIVVAVPTTWAMLLGWRLTASEPYRNLQDPLLTTHLGRAMCWRHPVSGRSEGRKHGCYNIGKAIRSCRAISQAKEHHFRRSGCAHLQDLYQRKPVSSKNGRHAQCSILFCVESVYRTSSHSVPYRSISHQRLSRDCGEFD